MSDCNAFKFIIAKLPRWRAERDNTAFSETMVRKERLLGSRTEQILLIVD
jgi:hypothetical protein